MISIYRYNNNWIKVDRNREQQTSDLHMGIPFETVTLTALGNRRDMMYNILEEGLFHADNNFRFENT